MTARRAGAWLAGGTLLAAWLAAAAAPSLAPQAGSASPKSQGSETDRRVLELAVEADRLHDRLSVVLAPPPVMRNPFQFSRRAPAPAATVHVAREPEAPPPPAVAVSAPPPITFLGVAEDTAGTNPARTAILSFGGDLLLVKEGELIGDRYRLTKIGSDVIELQDSKDSRTFRIVLP